MEQAAIVGGGLIGLACASSLASRGHHVTILERNAKPGQEVSARNSGVIHAGIYYPEGTLKGRLCVEGRERLYLHCERWGVPHVRCGKLIVAIEGEQIQKLEELRNCGRANGVSDLDIVDGAEVARCEPRVRAVAALRSPSTGIVDVHELLKSLQADAERHGAVLATHTEVFGLELTEHGSWLVNTRDTDGNAFGLEASVVVNAAGLGAETVASMAGLDTERRGLTLHPCKGDYFALRSGLGEITRGLVYPVPEVAGLGIHVTYDIAGAYRLGPDSEYVDVPRFDVDPGKAEAFAKAVQPFLPEIHVEDLRPDYAGVRPKLQAKGEAFRDFVISDGEELGLPGLINLVGIESPGLTACLAVGDCVAKMVG